jgi:hypothetical protein
MTYLRETLTLCRAVFAKSGKVFGEAAQVIPCAVAFYVVVLAGAWWGFRLLLWIAAGLASGDWS